MGYAEDDSAVRPPLLRHVDYLSQSWEEEDIWSSWKLIASAGKDYDNSVRLENGVWRVWMKTKCKLNAISPKDLNWLKDCDITWLYGPLQVQPEKSRLASGKSCGPIPSPNKLSKKPILKKKGLSEIMLQRSLLSSSLLKRAAAAVHAQHSHTLQRPCLEPVYAFPVTFPSTLPNGHPAGLLSSMSSPDVQSPSPKIKSIHFNERVEQCIVLGLGGPAGGTSHGGWTIVMLPSTTLKHNDDSPTE